MKAKRLNYWCEFIIRCAPLLLLCLGLLSSYYIIAAPEDYLQGMYAKIMYLHIPTAWLSLWLYILLALISIGFLAIKNPIYHLISFSIAKVGGVLTLSTLISGSLWGKPTWGTYWVWDARLTSMLVLLLLYIAYLLINSMKIEIQKRANISAIFAVVGMVNIPLIKFSVNLWNTLHQPSSLLKRGAIHHDMSYPLWYCFAFLIILAGYMIALDYRYNYYKIIDVNSKNRH